MIKLVFQRKRWMGSINGQLDRHLRGKVQLDTLLSPYPQMTPAILNISKKNKTKISSRRKGKRIFTVRMGKVFLFII